MVAPTTTTRTKCRHCQERVVSRPRGLCFNCHTRLDVRELYPAVTFVELGTVPGPRPLPAEPCPHRPGSPGRIATLMARAEAETLLWHPNDASAR